jgi:hypothetical protein
MGDRAIDPTPYQQNVTVDFAYAKSIARAAMVHIKKYRRPYAVVRYGREYIVRRSNHGHIPEHWQTLAWYELVGVYDQNADIDLIAEDILATARGEYQSIFASKSDMQAGSKSK